MVVLCALGETRTLMALRPRGSEPRVSAVSPRAHAELDEEMVCLGRVELPVGNIPASASGWRVCRYTTGTWSRHGDASPALLPTEQVCRHLHFGGIGLGGIRTRSTALRRRGPDPVLVEDGRPGGETRTPSRSLIERLLCLELRQVGARDGNRTRLTRSTAGQPLQMLTRAKSERGESNSRLRFVGPRPFHWATLRSAWPELNRQSPGPRPGGFPASLHAV
jgi:hypothetical protein